MRTEPLHFQGILFQSLEKSQPSHETNSLYIYILNSMGWDVLASFKASRKTHKGIGAVCFVKLHPQTDR